MEKDKPTDNKKADVKKDEKATDKKGAVTSDKKGKPMPTQSIPTRKKVATSKDFRGIIRIAGKDMDGYYTIYPALRQVKGVGQNLARILTSKIVSVLKIPEKTLVGELTEDQLTSIEELIKSPTKHGVPAFMLNRTRDADTGNNTHLLTTDLVFQVKQDIQREKELRSWRGWRHSLGQRVRGQHNRTTGRSGLTIGVVRKSLGQKPGAPAEGAKDDKK